ncbi:hypothetical protein BDV95DRAFT_628681 [Massariosphaeria phaeospora]|uniref:HMG box domain-containing protein n=1 Tax=Massariosphaeria phaeospora TaxID=100035 RepID=A0A7C8MEQ1_9PLEO|nr:hypothetical protein BDV95DRAFT_628681 [Massariosphaeria phaeospora]
MADLSDVLKRLGLTTYHQSLVENGFHNWNTVLDITEDDLTALKFKLGHRRVLQREIATHRGIPLSMSLEPSASTPSELSSSALESLSKQTTSPPSKEKRRYRRHPRPDVHAPKKPKTACTYADVNFADKLRSQPDIRALSFVDIAREVGQRWQTLPADQKRAWESQAARAMQEFEAQMDEYKKSDNWRKYQVYLGEFKTQHTTAKSGRPKSARSGALACSTYSRPSSSDSPLSCLSSTSTGTEAEACHNALTLALSEIVSLRGEILAQGIQTYDQMRLPSEGLVRRAMHAFVEGTGSLLFMWTAGQVDEILERVYRPQKPVDAMTLAECFTVSAMGGHYDVQCFPDRIRRILYASGTLHFHEKTARSDYLRTMRLLLSMSFYALLEKHMSARYLIAAGLQIGRWKCPRSIPDSTDTTAQSWRRIFRSLIFMDCWLSYTLGYRSEVTTDDVSFACTPQGDCEAINEAIHIQTSKIGLLAAEIANILASPELSTRENVNMLAEKLEAWRNGVPAILQIPTLIPTPPPELSVYQKRAILMLHIMYLGALILLYRQTLVATAEKQLTEGETYDLDLSSTEDAKRYRDECGVAAQSISRLLSLIKFDGTLTKRCWLIIYWSFTACIVLLFSAMTKLIEGPLIPGLPDGINIDLGHAKDCMNMLEECRDYEPIASRYLNILTPLYDNLREVHHRMVGKLKTSIFSLLQIDPTHGTPPVPFSKTELAPIAEKLSMLLTDPFGRKQNFDDSTMRRLLNADGSCSVFWWK